MYIRAKNEIKCVIFDLDGTLLDTLEDLHKSVNYALQSMNLPERSREEVKSFVGNGIKKLIEYSVPDKTSNEIMQKVFSAFQAYYAVHCEDSTRPYPGIMDMLGRLKKRGIRCAILSNKAQFAVTKLQQRFFADLISLALGESETVRRKPDPTGILQAMRILNVKKEETLYVGDSDVDITTCKNANVQCISVTWGFRDKNFLIKNGASDIIEKPCDILPYFSHITIGSKTT